MAGMAGSNYSPVTTLFNNPSNIVDSKAFIDVNLVGVSAFVRNDLVFIPAGFASPSRLSSLEAPGYRVGESDYKAYTDVMVHGPSATFAVKSHAFGIITNFRTIANVRGIDGSLAEYIEHGFQYLPAMGQLHEERDIRLGALSWAEAGIAYGTILSRRGDMITQGGITLRRLWGVAGAGVRVDNWTYQVRDSSNIDTFRFSGEYGFNDVMSTGFDPRNGSGVAMDIGVMFKQRFKSSEGYVPHDPCTDGDYRMRFGFSLHDIGRIRFRGQNYINRFSIDEQNEWNDFGNTQIEDLSDLDSLFIEGFGAVRDNADGNNFTMMLPATISAQIDYNWGYGFYTYGSITAGLPWLSRLGVQRASNLTVVPRWEKKRFEASIPFTLFEFQKPLVGFALRLNSIIIGSDDLAGLLFNRNTFGADFYFSLKYTMFKHWKCSPKTKKTKFKRSKNAFEPVPCPAW